MTKQFRVFFNFDFKFWALLPALNLNINSKSLEFEWLCLGVYVDFAETMWW